jgi:hypothetical protein
MSSTLIAHVDTTYKTRDQLQGLHTPEGTRSWKPIPHYELVSQLIDDFARRGITVVREQYATGGKDDAKLFGCLDLAVPEAPDDFVGTAVGIRAANDKSMRVEAIAASRVFVCDNMAFSGSNGSILLKKKHTSGLDLSQVIPPAIDLYLDKAGVWRQDIDKMREFSLSDGMAKQLIYDSFLNPRGPVLPKHCLEDIHELYFDDEEQRAKFADRTLWSLNNAYTEAVKALEPVSQEKRGVEIGRFFGRVLARAEKKAARGTGRTVVKIQPNRIW